ncbi:MAG: hypothetical protein SFY81_16380 [Verrucomicrobiota bacterium]|nr:hypothetical protein [Verrucomicrobiota bacterium]
MFLVIVLLNFLGGALNEVSNGDSISYRIPRALHWLSEGQWHWIQTADERLNVVGCNYEFLCAPLLHFFDSFRVLFLISFSAYLLLPGLIYTFLRLVGGQRKVAWWWMWLLPGGFIYAMQASSVATDGFSATAALAAVVLALYGLRYNRAEDLCLSIAAAGFLAGVKQVNLPLGIIWIIPLFLGLKLLLRKPLLALTSTMVAILCSPLFIILANIRYTGSWKGFQTDYEQDSAFWGIIGNVLCIFAQNLQPPIFPYADAWNELMRQFVQSSFGNQFKSFESFMTLWRAPNEINAGLGFGLTVLLMCTLGKLILSKHFCAAAPGEFYLKFIRWSSFIAAASFMAKSGLMQAARYMAPYYPFLLAPFLVLPRQSIIITTRWWRKAAFGTLVLTIALLSISRQRPFWPAAAVTAKLVERFPESRFIRKVHNSYAFFNQLGTVSHQLRQLIPDSEKIVAYTAIDGMKEAVLWRSAENRKVVWINPTNEITFQRPAGLNFVLVEPSAIATTSEKTIDSWLKRHPGSVIGEIKMKRLPESAPESAYVVKLDPDSGTR